MPRRTPDKSVFRTHGPLVVAYTFFATCGLLAFLVTPSTSLARQGGQIIVVAFGVLCLASGICGIVGLTTRRVVVELFGASLFGAACLTWGASVVLQAISTGSWVPLTAACLAFGLVALITQRWMDARRP